MEKELVLRDIKVARRELSFDDIEGVSTAAFYTSQAVEKYAKYILFENGVEYPKTHAVNILLGKLDESNIDYPAELLPLSHMLLDWAVTIRYNSEFFASQKQVLLILDLLCEWMSSEEIADLGLQTSNQFQK